MKTNTMLIVGASACLALTGCGPIKKLIGGKPTGQVVATVNGEEITVLELRRELGGFTSRDPAVMKRAQQQALQQIIMRDLLVQQAESQKLDKSPEYTLQVKNGEQTLKAQLYQRKIASGVPAPTKQEAEAYVASHPEAFANRKVLVISQIIARPTKIDPERFKPLKTLDDVKALFSAEHVVYEENVSTLDTLSADPRMIAQIDKLPPGEVFVVPQKGALVFNRIAQSSSVPFSGDMATAYATNLLRQQRAQEAVRKQMESLRTSAESKIVYNPNYKPDAPAKPGAATPPKPAAAAAPPTK